MERDFVDIVEDVVNDINLTLDVKSVVGPRINLCDTLFLTKLKIITDESGNQYKITDFLDNEWIEVEVIGASPFPYVGSVVICPDINYQHGTPSSTNEEYLDMDAETFEKMPLVWLLEPYDEVFFGLESSVERDSKFTIFFLDETDEAQWLNTEHHRLVIKPQSNLRSAFIKVIENAPLFKTYASYNQKPRARFGVFVQNVGPDKKIINEDLSGVELTAGIERFKCSTEC